MHHVVIGNDMPPRYVPVEKEWILWICLKEEVMFSFVVQWSIPENKTVSGCANLTREQLRIIHPVVDRPNMKRRV
jgi:hypothetical protein